MLSILRQKHSRLILCAWIATLLSLMIIAKRSGTFGWDLWIYTRTVHNIKLGLDPYQQGIAAQSLPLIPGSTPSMLQHLIYIYPPTTIPFLHLVALLHARPAHYIYWLLYLICAFVPPIVALQFATRKEHIAFSILAPFSIYLNGALIGGIVYSGNVAYILYGFIFLGAWRGWRHNRWLLFYLAVLFAGCIKPPMLSLLIIPVFSARKQWIPAAVSAFAGVGALLLSRVLWPSAFSNYMIIMRMRFLQDQDLGLSPTSLFSSILSASGHASPLAGWIFYLISSVLFLAMLLPLRRRFLDGKLTPAQYIPVLSIGAIVFNPRIMEYDVASVSLFAAILLWRILRASARSRPIAIVLYITFFLPQIIFHRYLGSPTWHGAANNWRVVPTLALLTVWIGACLHLYLLHRQSKAPLPRLNAAA